MNYHNITHDDMLNGTGLRVVLWVAGCSHNCIGCQNPITWDPTDGKEFDFEAEKELYFYLTKNYTEGITFSGGDPLFEGNRKQISILAEKIKKSFPKKNIWLYTGYKWEEVKDLHLMKYIDVLVDGKFIKEYKDDLLHWRGSSNQRIIDVQKTLELNKVVLFE